MSFLDELLLQENGLVAKNSDQEMYLLPKEKISSSMVNGNELQIEFLEEESRVGLQLFEA